MITPIARSLQPARVRSNPSRMPSPIEFLPMLFKQSIESISLALCGCLTILAAGAPAAIYDRHGRKLPDREVNSSNVNWQMLKSAAGKEYNGIGAIDMSMGTCTGFVIDTGNLKSAPAYVVTNAHCQGGFTLPSATEIIVDRQTKEIKFTVNYFQDFNRRRWSIPVEKIAYATMKNNDLAVLKLATTVGAIERAGIHRIKLAPNPPTSGEPIEVVGIPGEGVEPRRNYLHQSTCQMGNSVTVKEDAYLWRRALRHRCSIIGGMSGSPMISLKTNRVVGIVNTGVSDNSSRQAQCSLNRPCEVKADGTTQLLPLENYGQPVDVLAGCFNAKQVFDLSLSTCKLEKP